MCTRTYTNTWSNQNTIAYFNEGVVVDRNAAEIVRAELV